MTQKSNLPYRHSIRLKDYDYSSQGAYFVTICTHHRQYLFGQIVNEVMNRNRWGDMAWDYWKLIPDHFPHAQIDAFVVMPNHIHGILFITHDVNPNGDSRKGGLGAIVGSYKSVVSKQIHVQFDVTDLIWQRNYHEHIIRNPDEYNILSAYIQDNPRRWIQDVHYV
jgi:REP element-mobilizing transposase RayT